MASERPEDLGEVDATLPSPVSEFLAKLAPDETIDAQAILSAHPELFERKSDILDVVYEEYCRRLEHGNLVDPSEFGARFPAVHRSFLRLVEAHRLIDEAYDGALRPKNIEWPTPGDTWLNFRILEELGSGAFSRVFLACDQALGNRLVVMKVTPLGPQEAETLGRLEHLNVVPVHSVQRDEERGLTAVCMPFLSRVSLFDVIEEVFSSRPHPTRAAALLDAARRLNSTRGAQVPVDREGSDWNSHSTYLDGILEIGLQLTEALAHAHRLGVLHCDVKPSNVLLTNRGRALLLDFNFSRLTEGTVPFVAGTLPYMAPEQLQALFPSGPSPPRIDARTDIYSLGATLFELAYGRSPVGDIPTNDSSLRTAAALLERQKRGAVLPDVASTVIDQHVGAIICRCLEFDPARRPQSMDDLRKLLAGQRRLTSRTRRWFHRNRTATATTIVGACVAALALLGWLIVRDPLPIREYRQGQAAYERGDYAAAEHYLTVAVKEDPQLHDAQFLRACAYLRDSNFGGAYADFDHLLKQEPSGRTTAGLAHLFASLQADFRRAAFLYEQAIDQGYRSPVAYNNLAYCRLELSRFPEATKALRTALSIQPDLPSAHHLLARIELRVAFAGKRVPDMTAMEKALRLGPETAELNLDAAQLFALWARYGTDAEHDLVLDRTFWHLQRAIDCGIVPPHLAAVASMYPDLELDPRWAMLQAQVQPGTPVSRAVLLLDPLPELLASSGTPSLQAGR